MSITLRPYQTAALRSLWNYFETESGAPCVVIPTAGGKSLVIAEWLRAVFDADPSASVIVLSHVSEILTQNMAELLALWPDAPCGLYSAKLGKKDIGARIMFASIGSIYKKAFSLPSRIDLVIFDECHLVSNDSASRNRKFLDDLKIINPDVRAIGFSATPYRMGSGLLTDGENRLFTDIAYEAEILPMIQAGYLAPISTVATTTKLDVSGVALSGGDYVQSQLEAAVDLDEITQAAVKEMVALGADRRSWLVFCSGVAHAGHVRDAIKAYGITCETITGETPQIERNRLLAGFKAGSIKCLTNANVLTTGLNVRGIDFLAFLRPTKSASLFVQMCGRAMRLSPETGKTDAIIADFAGNVDFFGPIDQIKVRSKKGDGVAPTKFCEVCKERVFASARICPNCGADFPEPIAHEKLNAKASTAPILSTQQCEPQWCVVTDVRYATHEKMDKPTSLQVTYHCGLAAHREWICLEHSGYPRQKACDWWRLRSSAPIPATVAEADTASLRKPTAIQVRPVGKYVEITGYKFD